MRTCPKCWESNLPTATACARCALPFDQTAMNLSRNCPAGRHVMDPTWTVCAFCKAEGLVTDDMDEPIETFFEDRSAFSQRSTSMPPPPPLLPRKTQFEGGTEDGSGGTYSEGWTRKGEPVAGAQSSDLGAGRIEAAAPEARPRKTQFEESPGWSSKLEDGTVREVADAPVARDAPGAEDWSKVRKTVLDDSPAIKLQGGRPMAEPFQEGSNAAGRAGGVTSKTGYGGPGAPQVAAGDQRKIVGILITYTWKPEGQVFYVREGRNWIGRDPAQADIAVPQDETLSSVNSTISFRSKFLIGDKDSMCGTWLEGKPVEELSHPLPNYAKIRTGSTTWTFIAIEPYEQGVTDGPGS